MKTIETLVSHVPPVDEAARRRATERLDQLTMPHWALGRLMDLAADLAGMTGSTAPQTSPRAVLVFAGDHGVAAEGVSRYPQEVTGQMVANFLTGGAGINALAHQAKADVKVVDMGVKADLSPWRDHPDLLSFPVAPGTDNMAQGPAMTKEQAVASVAHGAQAAAACIEEHGYRLVAVGEMGIANTTAASAIIAALCRVDPEEVTDRGTGVDDAMLRHKGAVIRRALERNSPDPGDPLDVLAKVGGFEIGGIAGAVLAAAGRRVPVLVDGLIATAGALVACRLCPQCAPFLIAAHRSVERGHKVALEEMGKQPLLDLNLRLGEGTGAAVAMNLVDAAVSVLTRVRTFAEAAVSEAVS